MSDESKQPPTTFRQFQLEFIKDQEKQFNTLQKKTQEFFETKGADVDCPWEVKLELHDAKQKIKELEEEVSWLKAENEKKASNKAPEAAEPIDTSSLIKKIAKTPPTNGIDVTVKPFTGFGEQPAGKIMRFVDWNEMTNRHKESFKKLESDQKSVKIQMEEQKKKIKELKKENKELKMDKKEISRHYEIYAKESVAKVLKREEELIGMMHNLLREAGYESNATKRAALVTKIETETLPEEKSKFASLMEKLGDFVFVDCPIRNEALLRQEYIEKLQRDAALNKINFENIIRRTEIPKIPNIPKCDGNEETSSWSKKPDTKQLVSMSSQTWGNPQSSNKPNTDSPFVSLEVELAEKFMLDAVGIDGLAEEREAWRKACRKVNNAVEAEKESEVSEGSDIEISSSPNSESTNSDGWKQVE
uniref:Uncharacterized protein n=1 Tax=Caenorhabditis tropicalis TaxID=1561998 RepID=A0A1I7TPK7_9PELO